MVKYKKILDRAMAYLKKNGVRLTIQRAIRKVWLSRPVHYEKWLDSRRLSKKERQTLQETYGSLEKKIVCCDSFQKACVSEAEYILCIQSGGCMEKDAGLYFARAIKEYPQAQLFYCDSDKFCKTGNGLEQPLFAPDYDEILLKTTNYINGGFLIRRNLLLQLSAEKKSWTEDTILWPYEVFLRAAEMTEQVIHLPFLLYHAAPETVIETRKMVENTEDIQEKISILIPNKDHPDMLRRCVESIFLHGGYENLEILILENNSTSPETFLYYQELEKSDRPIRVLYWEKEFNYSAINNYGAAQAEGRYLLFLNNDTQMISENCIRALLMPMLERDVAAVGAKLFYPDQTIQHAGVILGYGGIAGHVFEGMRKEELMQIPWARAVRQYSAVTAACMMVKKEVFDAVGGFDTKFQVAYNDIDLCLRIRAADQKIVYTPYAELIHYESATRGLELTKEKAQRVNREADLFRKRWQQLLQKGDPFYNPNLTLEKNDYSLQR